LVPQWEVVTRRPEDFPIGASLLQGERELPQLLLRAKAMLLHPLRKENSKLKKSSTLRMTTMEVWELGQVENANLLFPWVNKLTQIEINLTDGEKFQIMGRKRYKRKKMLIPPTRRRLRRKRGNILSHSSTKSLLTKKHFLLSPSIGLRLILYVWRMSSCSEYLTP